MRYAIHDEKHNETYLPVVEFEMRDEDKQCCMCAYWNTKGQSVHVKVGGKNLEMRQCMAGEESSHDDAPYAEVQGFAEAAIFTHAEQRCGACEIMPEVLQEIIEAQKQYEEMRVDRWRDAWNGAA